jgi:hypothetical protein
MGGMLGLAFDQEIRLLMLVAHEARRGGVALTKNQNVRRASSARSPSRHSEIEERHCSDSGNANPMPRGEASWH